MVWVRRDLEDHLVPTSLQWAGTPFTRPGVSKKKAASNLALNTSKEGASTTSLGNNVAYQDWQTVMKEGLGC